MPARAKAKAKAKAKPKAKAQPVRLVKTQRQKNRRVAVQELNKLSSEVDLAAPRLPIQGSHF